MLMRLSDSAHAANLISTLFMLDFLLVTLESDWRTSTSLCWTWFYIITMIEMKAAWVPSRPYWHHFDHVSVHVHVNWMYFRSEGRKHGLNRTHWRTVDKQGSTVTDHKLFFSTFLSLMVCFTQCSGCRVWTACMKYCILRIEKASLGTLMMTMSIKNGKMYTIMQKGNLHCNLVYCITKLTLCEM